MKVKEYLMRKIDKGERLHLSLIDPAEQSSEKAISLAKFVADIGTNAILIGGSYAVKQEKLNDTIRGVKETISLPIILFPSSVAYISKYADAILFLSLLNSKDPKYIVLEPAKGAPIIRKLGIQQIPTAYLVFEPGMRVGKRGKAKLLREKDIDRAVELALFAEYVGFDLLYLEAGSGAPKTVPNSIIKAIRKETNIPIIVGGGIRIPEVAEEKLKAGADIIVTGNIIEKNSEILKHIISAVKEYNKKQ